MDHPNKLPNAFPMPPSIPFFGFSEDSGFLLPPNTFPRKLFPPFVVGFFVVLVAVATPPP